MEQAVLRKLLDPSSAFSGMSAPLWFLQMQKYSSTERWLLWTFDRGACLVLGPLCNRCRTNLVLLGNTGTRQMTDNAQSDAQSDPRAIAINDVGVSGGFDD